MTVYVVMPTHNNVELTLACLACLDKQTYPDLRVIVIDDGSTDNTSSLVREKHPDAVLLQGDGNLWWTGATRLGVDYSLARSGAEDFILTLNNDVLFGEEYVTTIVDASETHGRAIVGSFCREHNNPELLMNQGGRFDWRRGNRITSLEVLTQTLLEKGIDHPPEDLSDEALDRLDAIENLDYVFGRGTLIPMEVFTRIGNYNSEVFPHYHADTEFSYRARNVGFTVLISLRARIESYEAENTSGIHLSSQRFISWQQVWQILTSIKSAYEVKRRFRFVDECCPKRYVLRNKIQSLRRILALSVGRTMLFAPVWWSIAQVIRWTQIAFRVFIPKRGRAGV